MSAGAAPAIPPVLYIPSTTTQTPIYSTDEYIEKTRFVYHCQSGRLLTVGNPYFAVAGDVGDATDAVPKVSANQFRVFRVRLPDPNGQFNVPDGVHDPEKFRLVWQLIGVEVCRGQPLGVGLSAAPLYNKGRDVENPTRIQADPGQADNRVNVGIDPKQVQMIIVGCAPAVGQHWREATPCEGGNKKTKCPPIELINTAIEDGDMSDLGFGPMDYNTLSKNTSDVPLELIKATAKYPDYIKMLTDPQGDSCFYIVRREQLYTRRLWQHSGNVGEQIPDGFYRPSRVTNNSAYVAIPSGSVVTSDTQLFNRPYWLSRAQGPNNGVCWGDNIFVTVLDNTRNTILNISTVADNASEETETYKPSNYNAYVRHVEEFELMFLVRLCRVPLDANVLAHIYRNAPFVLGRWGISEQPQTSTWPDDVYRHIESQATRCPLPQPAKPVTTTDPFGQLKFWDIDCSDKLSLELPLYPLGRKFLSLPGARTSVGNQPAKRPATRASSGVNTRSKRRRI